MERPLSFFQRTADGLSPSSGLKSSKSHTKGSGGMATFFWLWISALRKMEKWLDKASLTALVWLALKACPVQTGCKNSPPFICCYSGTCCSGSWPRKPHGKRCTLHIAVGLWGAETSRCSSRAPACSDLLSGSWASCCIWLTEPKEHQMTYLGFTSQAYIIMM